MARTDLHRPSAINPEDYHFVACDYYGGGVEALAFTADKLYFRQHRERTGGRFAQQHSSGTCHVCGARAMYVAHYWHQPTNEYITTGMDCAAKMDIADENAFKRFKATVRNAKHFYKGKAKAYATLCALGMSVAIELHSAADQAGYSRGEQIIVDVVGKLAQYGSLSPAQVALLDKLICDRANKPAQEAARAAQAAKVANSQHVGTVGERVEMEVTINYVASRDTQFGVSYFHSLVDAAGNQLMYSGSKQLGGKGETVRVKATVKRHGTYRDLPQTEIARPALV